MEWHCQIPVELHTGMDMKGEQDLKPAYSRLPSREVTLVKPFFLFM